MAGDGGRTKDSLVLPGQDSDHGINQRTSHDHANNRSHEGGEVRGSYCLDGEVVGRCREDLRHGDGDADEPGDSNGEGESGPEDDGG